MVRNQGGVVPEGRGLMEEIGQDLGGKEGKWIKAGAMPVI
jgi:hypothetical protein